MEEKDYLRGKNMSRQTSPQDLVTRNLHRRVHFLHKVDQESAPALARWVGEEGSLETAQILLPTPLRDTWTSSDNLHASLEKKARNPAAGFWILKDSFLPVMHECISSSCFSFSLSLISLWRLFFSTFRFGCTVFFLSPLLPLHCSCSVSFGD